MRTSLVEHLALEAPVRVFLICLLLALPRIPLLLLALLLQRLLA
jgi:hypothetical protein